MRLSPLFHEMPPRMRLLKASFHRREFPNSANPECLPQGPAIAQGLLHTLSATTPKLVWLRPGLAPSEHVVAVAPRRQNRNPREIHPAPP